MSWVPVTPGGSVCMHLESGTEEAAWTALLRDAAHMPYVGKQDFINRGYTVEWASSDDDDDEQPPNWIQK